MITAALSRRRAATRGRLMDAALQVFAERGVLGASVEEISERAGFTRGAFYSNFGSKDELVLALLDREAAEQMGLARQAIEAVLSDPPETEEARTTQLGRTIAVFFAGQHRDRDWEVAQRELRLHAIRTPQIAADFASFDARCRDELLILVADAMRVSGREFVVPVDQAVSMLIAIYEHTVLESLTVRPGPDRAADPGALLTTLLTAITRPRPVGGGDGRSRSTHRPPGAR